MSRSSDTTSRRAVLASAAVAGAVSVGGCANAVATTRQHDFPFHHTDERFISVDEPGLPALARSLIAIGNDGIARENAPAMRAFFHPDFRFHGPGTQLDREGLWAYFAACRAAFDDFTVTRQTLLSDGAGHMASRTRFAGTFVRPFTGDPGGTIEPNGLPFEYRVVNVFDFAPDGRVTGEWVQYDVADFLAQLRRPARRSR